MDNAMSEPTTTAEPDRPGTPNKDSLISRLIQRNYDEYAGMSQLVIQNLEKDKLELQAELAIVRSRIHGLCSKPWTPHPDSIVDALLVTRGDISIWIDSAKRGVLFDEGQARADAEAVVTAVTESYASCLAGAMCKCPSGSCACEHDGEPDRLDRDSATLLAAGGEPV